MQQTIPLGFSIPAGDPVAIPLRHLAVTGQTQESGKTTTLEALVTRAGVPAIAFVTKRGEGSFADGRRLQPYFRERADWQFVDQLLEAQLREKNKFLRPWLMKTCRNTRTLAEVHAAIKASLKKAKGFNEGIYTQLDAYLELIVPEIGRARLAKSIDLAPGLNVMDVGGFTTPMQMLFVQSAIDWVNEHEKGVVVIIPEAWEFIPEGKGSPVKASAVALVRKGAALGNFIWVDSQDMAGVAKEILRGCTVWLIGVQREANEIKRNLLNIPAGIARPKPGDIARLDKGQFFACWKDQTVKTYVQPAWMTKADAITIARGNARAEEFSSPKPPEEPVSKELETKVDRLADMFGEFLKTRKDAPAAADRAPSLPDPGDAPAKKRPPVSPRPESSRGALPFEDTGEENLYQRFKSRLAEEAPHLIKLVTLKPEIEVEIKREVVTVDGATPEGQFAQLIATGFFDEPTEAKAAFAELKRRGGRWAMPSVSNFCRSYAGRGFLTIEPDGYQAVQGMKINIKK